MNLKRAIVIGCSAGLVGQSFANILVNPGFESGDMTGWTTSAFTATNNDWHTGSWSTIDTGNFFLEQDFAPIAGSDISEISVWAKQPDRGSFFFDFEVLYSDSTSNDDLGSGGIATDWTKFDFTYLVNPSKSVTGIRAWGYSAGGNDVTFYDDFVVNANTVPEPTSLAVLGLGAAALIRRRKK